MENKEKAIAKKGAEVGFFTKVGRGFKRFFVGVAKKIKGVWSELRKVSWPTIPTTIKQLGVVLVFVVIVLAFISLADLGLQQLLTLLQGA